MHQSITLHVLRAMGIPLPQQKFIFQLFSLWPAVRGRFNYTNLSRYGFFHERTYRRGFGKEFNWPEFNQRLLTIMIPSSHQVIAAMDASFIPKSGKHTPNRDWFYNGCAARVEKGLEASVVALIDVTANTAYSLLARQTPASPQDKTPGKGKKKGTGKGKRTKGGQAAAPSRIEVYLKHLREARPHFPLRLQHVAVDGFYACRPFVDGVIDLRLDVIGKLRKDASLCHLYAGAQKTRGRRRVRGDRVRWSNLDLSPWHNEGDIEKATRLYTATVHHNSFKRTIKVALLERKTAAGVSRALLFSTDLELTGEEIVRLYRARFQIEFLFRDAKGSMGLNHCQSRQTKGLDFHWNASFCAVNLAKWQEARFSHKQRFSAASHKQKCSNELLLEVFSAGLGLDLTAIKSHHAYQELCRYGVINQ